MLYREEEAEFNGSACTVTGVAVYDVEIENDYSRDVGGVDGPCVTRVELLHVDLDGYQLPPSAVEQIIGKASMKRAEEIVAETIQANLSEYLEAA